MHQQFAKDHSPKFRFSLFHKINKTNKLRKVLKNKENRKHKHFRKQKLPRITKYNTQEISNKSDQLKSSQLSRLSSLQDQSNNPKFKIKKPQVPRRSKFSNLRKSIFGDLQIKLDSLNWFKPRRSSIRSFEKDLQMIRYQQKKLLFGKGGTKRDSKASQSFEVRRKKRNFKSFVKFRNNSINVTVKRTKYKPVENTRRKKNLSEETRKISKISVDRNQKLNETKKKISNIVLSNSPKVFRKKFKAIDSILCFFELQNPINQGSHSMSYLATKRSTGLKVCLKTFVLREFVKKSQIDRLLVNLLKSCF